MISFYKSIASETGYADPYHVEVQVRIGGEVFTESFRVRPELVELARAFTGTLLRQLRRWTQA